MPKLQQPPRPITAVAWILIVLGLIGLTTAAIISEHAKRVPRPTGVAVEPIPSSAKPSKATLAAYTVAPTLPKYITIPSIGVGQTRVIPLGLLASGHIATPNNIFDTGWYTGSAKPGQPGAMFIYGHVSSWTTNGIFYRLKDIAQGALITVTRGDNTTYTYQVASTKIYPYNNVDMAAVLSPVNPGTPGLNLMTCTGPVITVDGASEFSQRLVVYASLRR
jgi:sortase (surface protein transpeptidase)